ncbi:hypothetical protein EB001_21460 [bacterium]|nr:hypothetical protein [bacterium]
MTVNINGTTGVSAVQPAALANTITTSMLQANSVNSQIIAAGSVTSSQLAANAANANITTGSLYPSQFAQPLTVMSANNGASTIVGSATVPFTSIPSWAKRITVMAYGLSTSGSSALIIQLGTASGFVTSGYSGMVQYGSSVSYTATTNNSGIQPFYSLAAGNYGYFNIAIHLLDSATNKWVTAGVAGDHAAAALSAQYAWGVTLGGVLTQVRFNTVNGTDTFDAGTVNVMYE